MTRTMDIDVAHLPIQVKGSDAPIWWGQLLMMVIEGVLFAILIASYCYVRVNFAVWPPPGIENPGLVLPTIGFVVLMISCVPMVWSEKALNEHNRKKVLLGLVMATPSWRSRSSSFAGVNSWRSTSNGIRTSTAHLCGACSASIQCTRSPTRLKLSCSSSLC